MLRSSTTGKERAWHTLAGGLCWLAVWILGAVPAYAAPTSPSSSDVEAAYLYNFGKFVRWSGARTTGPVQICIAGKDPFGATLPEIVKDEHIDGRPIAIRHLAAPPEGHSCAILFVNTPDPLQQKQYLAAVAGEQTLTVSDRPGFLEDGGVIEFLLVEDRVRFAINMDAAERDHLSLNSELVKVAVRVTGKLPGGGL